MEAIMVLKEKKRISNSKKALNLDDLEDNSGGSSSGSYGVYYQLSDKLGLKLLDFGTRRESALAEYNILLALSTVTLGRRRLTPKVYDLKRYTVYWNRGKQTRYGITMEHIDADDDYYDFAPDDAVYEANTRFILKGYIYHDFNDENVLPTKKGYRIIDFTPGYIHKLELNEYGKYKVPFHIYEECLPENFKSNKIQIEAAKNDKDEEDEESNYSS